MGEKIEKNIINDVDDPSYMAGSNYVNPELIPYACYYDDKTILTKNGELLQTIKISSFITNSSKKSFYMLRDEINKTFVKNSKNDNLSFWFQTVRKPVDATPQEQEYTNYVSDMMIKKWNSHYKWDEQYANEIYITIILATGNNRMSKSFDFIRAINFSLLKRSKLKEFETAHKLLSTVTNNIIKDLDDYNARYLIIKKINDVYYSEHLKFFSLIINVERKKTKLPLNDLSESLVKRRVAFGKNLIQIYDKTSSIYSCIISLKYCNNIMLSQLDKIIQLNQELIITQSVSFIDKKQVNDEMMKYFEILSLEENPVVLNLSEVVTMMPSDGTDDDRICVSQILIQLRSPNKDDLNNDIKELFKVLGKIGIVAVREEMFAPTLFWSQLPANFNFVKRFQKISVDNVGNYTSLFNFPTGKLINNHWGDCIMVLKSALNTPYFFSFHNDKNGNTLFIGPKYCKKTKYMNLFIMASTKQVKKIFYIDNTNRSRVFINSMDGCYYYITTRNIKRRLLINPFKMEKNGNNINFMLEWLYKIIKRSDDGMIKMGDDKSGLEQEWNKLKNIITGNIEQINKIGDVFDIAKKEKFNNILRSLKKWVSPADYGFIFNEDDTLDLTKDDIIGINLNTIVNNEELKIAIFDYIMYNIIQNATGDPTILAIDEGWILFDNQYFAGKMLDLMKQLYSKNIALVMTVSGADSYEASNIKASVKNIFPTQVLLPSLKVTVYQKKVFNISEEEARILSVMKEENNSIMLKHNGGIVVSSIDFDFMKSEELNIFCNNNIVTNIMLKAKELINSNRAKDWLHLMFTLIQEYNRVKFEQRLKEQEKRQIQWQEAKQSGANNAVLKGE
jgi:type IV secretion system protein VirB4